MTETCRNKTLKGDDIHRSWCFFKKEDPIQCGAKTPSQSFYDAFTAFLSSSSCAVELQESNVNESLCPNVELRKLELEEGKTNLMRQSAANTGCNEEKLGSIEYSFENCAPAEKIVANFWLTGDGPSIEKKCAKPAVSLSFADSNMSRDWPVCEAYKNEYPPAVGSGTGLRNLRSRDSYSKCRQNEGKSSACTSTFLRRSVIDLNCQEELSSDGKEAVEHNSHSVPYQQVQRLSSAGNFSRTYNSERQFLRPRNCKLTNNGNNESMKSECQLQYKEEYRRKLRSARDAGVRRAVSELSYTERAQQSRLSTLRRRNSLSSSGHVLQYDCFPKCRTQKALCRPVFVLLEKMSKKKIEQLQNEMKLCTKVMDATNMSGISETSGLKAADDFAGNYGSMNTSASSQMGEVFKISAVSRTDENEDEAPHCTKSEVTSTLQSMRTGMNFKASQFCSEGVDISKSETVWLADKTLNSGSSEIQENSDLGRSQLRIAKLCEKESLLHVQEVSCEVLNITNTKQSIETSGSIHVPELVGIISGSVSKHEKMFKPEIEKTCSSRTNANCGFEQTLHETNYSGCLPAAFDAVDQNEFKSELELSNVCNSTSSVKAVESVELSQVVSIHPLVTSDATELPKTLAKSDIIQDTVMSDAVGIPLQPGVDGLKDVSQTLDRVGVVLASPNRFSSSLSEPMKMKSRVKLVNSKPAMNCDIQIHCAENSEYFPKASNMDKRKKKKLGNVQNNVLVFNSLGAVSDGPKDCLKSSVTTSVLPTKARKRKAECNAASQKLSVDPPDDADAYVPNFMTHSQSLDESSLTEKWKEATDLEEWWLNDIGSWINVSAMNSTISSSTASEKSMSSEDFRWCAMIADQSEWPELELDLPTTVLEKSVDECNRNTPLTADAEEGQALHGEGANSGESDMNQCEDSQPLESLRPIAKPKCVKPTSCRVGKRKQLPWLRLKETGSLGTCKLTSTARKANAKLNDTVLDTGSSDNVAVASGVMELEADDKKHDQVDQMKNTSVSEALKGKSCEENADSGTPSSPSLVGTLSAASSPALVGTLSTLTPAANSTHISSVASGILAPSDVHMNRDAHFPCSPCDGTFSRTSPVTARCHDRSEALCRQASSFTSHSSSYLNLKCNAVAVGSVGSNHSSSTDLLLYSNSSVASINQNMCDSRFDFNPYVVPFNNEPSFAYFVPRSQAASKSCFIQNASAASITHTSSVKVASTGSHEQLARCQTISNEVTVNCATNSRGGSAQSESKAKGITTEKTLGPLVFSDMTQSNTSQHVLPTKHVIPVACSTMNSSSLASDSAITTSKIIDTSLSLNSSSFASQTDYDYSSKTEQSVINNEVYRNPNFVHNDLKNSKLFPTSRKAEVCEKDLAVDKNVCDHSFRGHLAEREFELPMLRIGLDMHGRSQERDEICSKDLVKDSQPCFSYAGLYRRFSKLDQGLSCDSSEALDAASENSSQDVPSEVGSKVCTKDVGPRSPSSEDTLMYNDCNSDMCSWLAASMGLYTCDCGAAFSDSWSCQQHQSRCSAVVRT